MRAEMEQTGFEAKQLRACINDLIGIVALPAIWSGSAPSEIVRTLLDALVSMLRLDFVYLRLKGSIGEPPFELVRGPHSHAVADVPQEIVELLKTWPGDRVQEWPRVLRNAFGDEDLSVIPLPLGLESELGILVAGSQRADFPVRTERLLLTVAANQAAVGLHGARLLGEQKRIAEELNRKVAQRTEELAAANRELQEEILKEQSLAAENLKAYEEIAALKARLEIENTYLQDEIRRQHNFEEILGNSPELLKLLDRVELTALVDANVLISGETGSGKELIARAIHSRSARKNSPLVKVNCGAIPSGLVESELFGHVKGAFTSASERRIGRFELANNGTLFLDEVGELPLETQVKLLRVLQEQEFEPVGSNHTVKVNVRIIAATNRDLEKAVQSGGFRSDLYYRLNVIPLHVPALRDRRSDIPQMVMAFLQQSAKRTGKPVQLVSRETMKLLADYSWPGNIRELQNVIERGVVLSRGSILRLGADLLPIEASETSIDPGAIAETKAGDSLEEIQRQHILRVLEKTGWVISGPRGAGAALDLHPNTLRSLMNRLG
ncbi:MAG TPA: sigma 54-interacting transcriptional regulator, partial [Terriglobia bacterium]|nr:sigma 54-interacting transcriptional regulator [Terriglobia bacterium]